MNPASPIDWTAAAWSLLFLGLGIYFALILPGQIRDSDWAVDSPEIGKIIMVLRPIGLFFALYCLFDFFSIIFHTHSLIMIVWKCIKGGRS